MIESTVCHAVVDGDRRRRQFLSSAEYIAWKGGFFLNYALLINFGRPELGIYIVGIII